MRSAVLDLASQPIRNYAQMPRAQTYSAANLSRFAVQSGRWSAYVTYSTVATATDGPPGTGIATYGRATVTGSAGVSRSALGFHLCENPEVAAPSLTNLVAIAAGEQYVVSTFFRSSAACTVRLTLRFASGAGTWLAGALNRTFDVTAASGEWVRLVLTGAAPAGAIGFASHVVAIETVPLGTTLDCTGLAQHRNTATDPGAYLDGDYPGWRWTGTAGASESVGYPYTLESIAGQPLAAITYPTLASGVLPLGAFDARTLYVVHDVIDTASVQAPLATVGSAVAVTAAGRFGIRTGAAAANTIETRVQHVGGAFQTVPILNVRTAGRHVSAAAVNDGVTTVTAMTDGVLPNAPTVRAVAAASGMETGSLRLPAATTSDAPVHALVYKGEHNVETQRRITAWLARQYGAPVPAGY